MLYSISAQLKHATASCTSFLLHSTRDVTTERNHKTSPIQQVNCPYAPQAPIPDYLCEECGLNSAASSYLSRFPYCKFCNGCNPTTIRHKSPQMIHSKYPLAEGRQSFQEPQRRALIFLILCRKKRSSARLRSTSQAIFPECQSDRSFNRDFQTC
jgi:hypothetical protein